MDVLVTGGSGFIGRVVVAQLRARGDRVTVADLNPFPDPDVPTVVGDLRDPDVLARAVATRPQGVIHLAALTSVVMSVERPLPTFEVNTELTFRLAQALSETRPAFAFASTNAAVGDASDPDGRLREDSPLRPLTPYGATKAAAESLLACCASSYGLPVSVLRLSNVYGPGMHELKDSFVARLLRAARDGEGVTVFGDGSATRDFLYLDDTAAGMIAGMDRAPLGVLNVGSGRATSVNELLSVFGEAVGRKVPVHYADARPGEMRAAQPDVSRLHALGLSADTSLAEGLARTWAAVGAG